MLFKTQSQDSCPAPESECNYSLYFPNSAQGPHTRQRGLEDSSYRCWPQDLERQVTCLRSHNFSKCALKSSAFSHSFLPVCSLRYQSSHSIHTACLGNILTSDMFSRDAELSSGVEFWCVPFLWGEDWRSLLDSREGTIPFPASDWPCLTHPMFTLGISAFSIEINPISEWIYAGKIGKLSLGGRLGKKNSSFYIKICWHNIESPCPTHRWMR